jgi:hypothetical protein
MVEPHRLAEARSLAYHRAVAARLVDEPALVDRARARAATWKASGVVPEYAEEWERLLLLPVEELARAMVEETEDGNARRQASPFAGAMKPRARWALWREVRERLER